MSNDVFENAVDLGVFVNDARDLDFRRRKADHGAQKDAAERIAERVAVAAFERFERDDGAVRIVSESATSTEVGFRSEVLAIV